VEIVPRLEDIDGGEGSRCSSGVGALWDCVLHVCGRGGGCAGGGVPLGAVLVLSWCGEVSLGGKQSPSSDTYIDRWIDIIVQQRGRRSSCGRLWCCSCRVVCCCVVVLFLWCRALCCSCCVFVCLTCFSSYKPRG